MVTSSVHQPTLPLCVFGAPPVQTNQPWLTAVKNVEGLLHQTQIDHCACVFFSFCYNDRSRDQVSICVVAAAPDGTADLVLAKLQHYLFMSKVLRQHLEHVRALAYRGREGNFCTSECDDIQR